MFAALGEKITQTWFESFQGLKPSSFSLGLQYFFWRKRVAVVTCIPVLLQCFWDVAAPTSLTANLLWLLIRLPKPKCDSCQSM